MNIDLLLTFLKNTLKCPTYVSSLSEEMHMPVGVVKKNILYLAKNGLVEISGEELATSGNERLSLAVLAIKEGADVERVCKALGWREFEDLTALILEQSEFKIKKHFRFKGSGRRYEIDVVGLREPLILSIECKHWKQSWRRAATLGVVRRHIERTEALVHSFPEPKNRLGVAKWREVKVMPLVLTLSNTPLKIHDGVAVVPVFHFNNFLNEMQEYTDELMILSKTKLAEQNLLN